MDKHKYKKYIWVIVVILILIIIDQIFKYIAINNFQDNSFVVIKDFLQLTYLKNMGESLEIVSGNLLTRIITDLIVIILVTKFMIAQIERTDKRTKFALSLILAGGISNLLDKLLRGGVINYIDITNIIEKFPIINIANIYIITGLIIFMIFVGINVIKTRNQKIEKEV